MRRSACPGVPGDRRGSRSLALAPDRDVRDTAMAGAEADLVDGRDRGRRSSTSRPRRRPGRSGRRPARSRRWPCSRRSTARRRRHRRRARRARRFPTACRCLPRRPAGGRPRVAISVSSPSPPSANPRSPPSTIASAPAPPSAALSPYASTMPVVAGAAAHHVVAAPAVEVVVAVAAVERVLAAAADELVVVLRRHGARRRRTCRRVRRLPHRRRGCRCRPWRRARRPRADPISVIGDDSTTTARAASWAAVGEPGMRNSVPGSSTSMPVSPEHPESAAKKSGIDNRSSRSRMREHQVVAVAMHEQVAVAARQHLHHERRVGAQLAAVETSGQRVAVASRGRTAPPSAHRSRRHGSRCGRRPARRRGGRRAAPTSLSLPSPP